MTAMKVVTLIARRPDLTREAFRTYYETRHAPLGTRYFPFEKYVRNHIVDSSPADPGFDCLMECWLDRRKALQSLEGPVGAIFAEDEAKFMTQRGLGVDVEERLIAGDPRGVDPRGIRKEALLVSAEAGTARDEFLNRVAAWAADLARQAGDACARLTLDAILPGQDDVGFPGDAILTAWRGGDRSALQGVQPPAGIRIRSTLVLESEETTPDELSAAYAGPR